MKVDPVTGDVFTEAQYSQSKEQKGDDGDGDENGGGSEEGGDGEGSEEAKEMLGEPDDVSEEK